MSDVNNPPTVRPPDTKLSNKIFDELVVPKLPTDTKYELQKRYWGLAGSPATHQEFTIIPDEYTLDCVKWDAQTLYMLGTMEGFELFSDIMQLQFVNSEMILKSIAFSDTPNLMDRMTGSMPSLRMSEGERKPDQSSLQSIGDKMLSILPGRR